MLQDIHEVIVLYGLVALITIVGFSAGCAITQDEVLVHTTDEIQAGSMDEQAQMIIDNNSLLAGVAATTVKDLYADHLITREDALRYAIKIDTANETNNDARKLLDLGKALEARDNARVMEKVLDLLVKELAKINGEVNNVQ